MTEEKKIIQPRTLIGEVVSDKMSKTRVIAIHRTKRHPKYGKYFRITKKFKAHDEENAYHVGDKVKIAETKPMSKEKRWTIIEKITI